MNIRMLDSPALQAITDNLYSVKVYLYRNGIENLTRLVFRRLDEHYVVSVDGKDVAVTDRLPKEYCQL